MRTATETTSVREGAELIEKFAAGDESLRSACIDAFRRLWADASFRVSDHARFMAEIASGLPDFAMLTHYRRRLVSSI